MKNQIIKSVLFTVVCLNFFSCSHQIEQHRRISSVEADGLDSLYINDDASSESMTYIQKINGSSDFKDTSKSCLNKFIQTWKISGVEANDQAKPIFVATTLMFPEASYAFDGMKQNSGKDLQNAQYLTTIIKGLSYAYFLADTKKYSLNQITSLSLDVKFKKNGNEFEKNIGGVFLNDEVASAEFDRIYKRLNLELKQKGFHIIEDKESFAQVMINADKQLAFCQDSANPKQVLNTMTSNIAFWTKEIDLQN